MVVRFNQLPENQIFRFIKDICVKENIAIDDNIINEIQKNYSSDIRSMINYLQLNKDNMQKEWKNKINGHKIMVELHNKFLQKEKSEDIIQYIRNCSMYHNTDQMNIIQKYLNHIVRNHIHLLNEKYFIMIENILHNKNSPLNETLHYFVIHHLHLLHT